MNQPAYKINLEIFEGPLDLLLYLIRKNDIEISDIPVSLVLDQYVMYLDVMKELDIDVAGEFIVMASELAHIKSRLLLNDKDDEQEEADPRSDLVARLKIYQQYKFAAQWLEKRPQINRDVFSRPEWAEEEIDQPKEEAVFAAVEPFQLITAFHDVLKRAPRGQKVHEVFGERMSVSERIYQILDKISAEESVSFESLFEADIDRPMIVISFLAILEMARLKMITIFQTERLGAIRVKRTMTVEVQAEKPEIDESQYH